MSADRSAPPRRVVFVNRFYFPDESATSQMLTDLCVSLAARGLAILVICGRQRYDQPDADLAGAENVSGVSIRRLRTTRFGRARLLGRAIDYASFYAACAFELLRTLRRGDIVVAKTDPPLISLVVAAAATLTGAELINWLQDVFPEVATELDANPLPRFADALLRRLRNLGLRRARMNVVIGGKMREFVARCGVATDRIRVIENWADAGAECKPTSASELRSRLGLAGKFVVCYSGNLGRAHEYQTVLSAAGMLAADRDIVVLFIGGGAAMTALMQDVLRHGPNNFCFIGYQPRATLSDSLAAADVHLVSLRPALEGLIVPSKFYGILAAGRAVIFVGDPDGELARVVRDARIGGVVDVDDGKALAAQIMALKSDPERCERMGVDALGLYKSRYSAQRALEHWLEVLGSNGAAASVKPPGPVDGALVQSPSNR